MPKPVVIVGAGLAGLIAARRLSEAQVPFLVLDADDRAGGRLKTDVVDGFRLDRGFQTLFTAYPTPQAELDMGKLDLRVFASGAEVFDGVKRHGLQFDRRDVSLILFNRFVSWPDKFRLGAWAKHLEDSTEADLRHEEDTTAETYLRRFGFSERLLDTFMRPFYGGVFLDRGLQFSSNQFNWVSKMLVEGDTVVPNQGIEAIPAQLAASLPTSAFRFKTRVAGLKKEGGRVTGVVTEDGETIEASAVILATSASESARLAGIAAPSNGPTSVCMYFETPEPVIKSKFIVLNGSGEGLANHVVPVTNLCPAAAPAGKHLTSVTLLDGADRTDTYLDFVIRKEMAAWFPGANPKQWRHLRTYRVRNAQLAQAPGFQKHAPGIETQTPGLFLAGEWVDNSSIEGAMRSGDRCGRLVASSVATPA
ncbi:MAG: oxidoreductase [Chthonomonas sp.]